ncbi:hypothetical protein PAQ31011_02393 [Pandoraea aquatica]|uniref:DUF2894 domain-containing protein n=1 Tax=Pandoraea aquatica TaxID=2508290 RepID=A0A5E4V3L2_9BURK|nr:DUF2894 domain-containing protein [Pandoraea aquatica]VVE05959.1 hypothetical protein PAQ31011_02393 [Pandoraea aquatica]
MLTNQKRDGAAMSVQMPPLENEDATDGTQAVPQADPVVAIDPTTAQLAAWREAGADKRDPARFHRIEALCTRMLTYRGDVRRVLEARVKVLVDGFAKSLADAKTSADDPAASRVASPLVTLTADITRRIGAGERPTSPATSKPTRSAQPTTTSPTASRPDTLTPSPTTSTASAKRTVAKPAPSPVAITPTVIATDDAFEDLDVLEYFRETWSKLSTDGNLRQSLAQVPENAGPLNSSHLVHRALSLMHDVSPDYLRHFLRHADALSWLEDMETTGVFGNKSAARVAASAKPSRAKAR